MNWQPIETAPLDGTRVILSWGGKSINGYFLDNRHTATPWAGWRVESMVLHPAGKPTHWQPFPPPFDAAVPEAAPAVPAEGGGDARMPTLPQSLLNLIGEYGMARTDGVSEVERLHRWEQLIAGIKSYAASPSAHQEKGAK